jgi:hypothetical protein
MVACCVLATSISAVAQQRVSASDLERNFWQTLKANDLAALQSMMTEDYLSVEDGVKTREQVIQFLGRCRLTDINLSDQQDLAISKDTVATLYRISEDALCGDKHYTGTYIATTVWVLRNGRWRARLHTEHPLEQTR